MTRFIFYIIILTLFSSCKEKKRLKPATECTYLGNFYWQIPNSCLYESFNSIDSEAGMIYCDSLKIAFDYGYLALSPSAIQTEKEYLEKNRWIADALTHIMPYGVTYSSDTVYNKIKVKQVDLKSHAAEFIYNGKTYFHKVEIPEYLKDVVDKRDTLNGMVRRLIYKEAHPNYEKEYEAQFMNTLKFNKSMNAYESLVMKFKIHTAKDSITAFHIFNSVHLKVK